MLLRFFLAGVRWIICLTLPAWADFKAGMDAYTRADDATAWREWRPLAEQGDANAQYYIGALHDLRKGVPQDFSLAREWYEKATSKGHTGAQSNLGGLYKFGHGVPQNEMLAYMWDSLAAAHSLMTSGRILQQTISKRSRGT